MIGVIAENINDIDLEEFSSCGISIFSNSILPVRDTYSASVYCMHNIYSFQGILIATNMSDAFKLLSNPSHSKNVLIVDNLEWTKKEVFNYRDLLKVYQSDTIKLVARTRQVYDDLKNFFKEPDLLLEKLDVSKIEELCNEV